MDVLKDKDLEAVLKDIEVVVSNIAVDMRKENLNLNVNMASIRHKATVGVLLGYIKGEYKLTNGEEKANGKQSGTSKKRSSSNSTRL